MSIRNKLNRSLGLENIADVPVADNDAFDDVGTVVDAVMPDGTPTPEADVVELEIVYDEAFTSAEDLTELVEAAQGIESIREAMHDAHQNGGMTQESARYAAVALEAIGQTYTASATDMGMVSLENFNDNRANATSVSMEGVIDTLKSWWATIVEKFKDLMKKIMKYYQETWSGAARLKSRAEGLKAKSRKVEGSIDTKTIEDKGLFNSLNIAGNVPTASNVVDGLKRAGVAAKTSITADTLESRLDDVFKLGKKDIASAVESRSFAVDLVPYTSSGSATGVKIHDAAPIPSVNGIWGLPGNQAIIWGLTKKLSVGDVGSTVKQLQSFQFRVITENAAFKAPSTAKKMDTLSLSDCENLCDIVIDNMANIIRNKTDGSKALKLADNVKKKGDEFIKDLDEEMDASKRTRATSLMTGVTHIAGEVQQGNAAVLRYNMRTSKAALSWVSRSMSNYKKK